MKDKELKLNASGYYDEPCYQAIKNVDAPKAGEIYIHGDTGKYVLVLNCVNGVCAILNLTEQEREGRIPVMARVQMYTNPIMINYTFASTLAQYVKTITDEECLEVKKAVSDALGLPCIILDAGDGKHQTRDKLEAEYAELLDESKALEAKVKALEEERDNLFTAFGHANGELIKMTDERDKAESERDKALTLADDIHAEHIQASIELGKEKAKSEFYREMYDALLDKVFSARGGSVNE